MFERARTEEQVMHRQNEIMLACEKLYNEKGYDGVNFKTISEMTSFTRPSIYNYYKHKDEVLLDLLTREMSQWQTELVELMEENETLDKESYAAKITEMLLCKEQMMKIFSILFSLLEKNSRIEKLIEFKVVFFKLIETITATAQKYFTPKPGEDIKNYILSFLPYVFGGYPMFNPTEKQAEATKQVFPDYSYPTFKDNCYRQILLILSRYDYPGL